MTGPGRGCYLLHEDRDDPGDQNFDRAGVILPCPPGAHRADSSARWARAWSRRRKGDVWNMLPRRFVSDRLASRRRPGGLPTHYPAVEHGKQDQG